MPNSAEELGSLLSNGCPGGLALERQKACLGLVGAEGIVSRPRPEPRSLSNDGASRVEQLMSEEGVSMNDQWVGYCRIL
jgi:hypothetical protein